MKRHFMMSLKALCTGVMTLCVASLSFTSCYDDSALNAEVDELGEKVTALDARLQAVEALTAKLEALTARVDALYTLKFQVTSTNELQYSFDGGTTWVNTGIKLAKELECTCKPAQPCTCVDVTLVDNGDSVTITVGDQSFTIEKPIEVEFELRAGRVYFESEGVQTIAIKSNGIDDVTVIAKPKGWEAEIDASGMLVVTAPNYADTECTYDDDWNEIPPKADYQGVIKVHACSVEGKCMVGKLPVEVSETPMVVKAYGGNYVVTSTSRWAKLFYGVSPRKTFKEDAQVLLSALSSNDYSVLDEWQYVAAPSAEGKIADVLGYEPKVGEEYVVYAIDEYAESFNLEDLVLAYYSPVDVKAVEDESKRNAFDVVVSIEVSGAESYYAYAVPDTGDGVDEAYQKENMASTIGTYWCPAKLHTKKYEGSLYSVAEGTMGAAYGMSSPNQDCYLFILPLDGRPLDEYTADEVFSFKYTTSSVVSGGKVKVSAEQAFVSNYGAELDPYTQLGVKINTPSSENWTYLYFSWFSEEEYAELNANDDLLVSKMTTDTWAKNPKAEAELPFTSVQDVEPATTVHFVAFFLDENYNYGELTKFTLTSDELIRSEILLEEPVTNLNEDMALYNNTTLELTLATDEPASMYKYLLIGSDNYYYNQYLDKNDLEMADEVHFSSDAEVVNASDLTDGKLVIEGHEYATSYILAILPYDEAGNPGKSAYMLNYDCVFELANLITDESAFVGEPVVTFDIPTMMDGSYGQSYYWHSEEYGSYEYTVGYTVTPAEGTEVVTVLVEPVNAADYGFDLTVSATQKASDLWTKTTPGQGSYINNFTEPGAAAPRSFYDYTGNALEPYILVSWKSGDSYYYKEISLAAEYATMLKHMNWDGEAASVANTPDAKQWVFNWTAMGMGDMNAVLDFGITLPGQITVAYDPAVMGAPAGTPYIPYNAIQYAVKPFDETSGVVVVTSTNMFGDESNMDIPYYNLTENSCSFATYNLLMQTAHAKAETVVVDMTGGGLVQ